MTSEGTSFPAPIGGVPFERDFGPSVFFACVYVVLAFGGAYRLAKSATRTVLIIGTFAFVVERYVSYQPC